MHVTHLARTDRDPIAGSGFYHAAAALRFLCPATDEANSELLVRVPGNVWRVSASSASIPTTPHRKILKSPRINFSQLSPATSSKATDIDAVIPSVWPTGTYVETLRAKPHPPDLSIGQRVAGFYQSAGAYLAKRRSQHTSYCSSIIVMAFESEYHSCFLAVQ